ncbi:MAG TPA: tetratricopeptide repeat protein [Chloroflexia bacterium]|jgi:tetratricopeptide (TPR) repeat protein
MQEVEAKDLPVVPPGGEAGISKPEVPSNVEAASGPLVAPAAEAVAAPVAQPEPQPAYTPEVPRVTSDPDDITSRFEEGLRSWILDTAKGIVTSTATVLFVLLLVQLGLASEGQDLSFDLFSPYEFWNSFSGLVIQWSQWNEWLLLALALGTLGVTVGLFVWWRRHQAREAAASVPAPTAGRKSRRRSLYFRVQSSLRSMKGVSAFGMISAILFGAYFYQQYLWNVELPVPEGQIGIAFTRQVGNSLARDTLAESLRLRQLGHGDQIVLRDLPVSFDPRDTAQAQRFARRIHAHAVIIYNEVRATSGGGNVALRVPGVASPSQQAAEERRFVAYLVFADPSLGIEIPVTQEGAAGQPGDLSVRTKEGLEVPRLEGTDTTRLMEAAAGVLMYDRDRYPAALSHLQNAVANGGLGNSSDALIHLYMGNAYYLLNQNDKAEEAFDNAIRAGESITQPGVQERLVLAQAYTNRAQLYFFNYELEQSETLLRKALRIKETLDQDETALANPTIFRQLHEMAGNAYLRLLDIALINNDEDARQLWSGRVGEEARALASRPDDSRAMSAATRFLYRSGACEEAYALAHNQLEKDPNNASLHRTVASLATLRDESVLSLEALQERKALLRLNPSSLPDLHHLLLRYSLNATSSDIGYLDKVKETTDAILAVDPTNVEAIERYVSAVDVAGTFDLLLMLTDQHNMEAMSDFSPYLEGSGGMAALMDPAFGYSPIGDTRTLRKVLAEQMQDPETIERMLAIKEGARPYLIRWAEEADPDTAEPVIQIARYSRSLKDYAGLYSSLGGLVEQEVQDRVWQRAFDDANAVLESDRHPGPRLLAEAHSNLSMLYRDRYLRKFIEQDKEAAGEMLTLALEHSRTARELIDSNPPESQTPGELNVNLTVYNDYVVAAFFATFYYDWVGDPAKVEEYTALHETLSARQGELQVEASKPIGQNYGYFKSLTCTGDNMLEQGTEALEAGEFERAVELLTDYQAKYAHDPVGAWSLALAQYRSGDHTSALQTLDRASEFSGDLATLSGKKVVVLLAQGKSADAQQAFTEFSARLESEPIEVRVRELVALGLDLQELAREKPDSREGVKALLPDVQRYMDGLPADEIVGEGAQMILALDSLGAASTWAGDYEGARKFLQAAVEINQDYVPARANLALVLLASGDSEGAASEYNRAVKAVATYIRDPEGETLRGASRKAALEDASTQLQAASADLERLLDERPELEEAGGPLLDQLNRAASLYEP